MSTLQNGTDVPQEIVDYIVEFLASQVDEHLGSSAGSHEELKRDFSSYILVSRAWVPQCRIHLHQCIRFCRNTDARPYPRPDAYDRADVAKLVQHVSIAMDPGTEERRQEDDFSGEKDEIIWKILSRLSNIISLSIYGNGFISQGLYEISTFAINTLSQQFRSKSSLTDLKLYQLRFRNPESFSYCLSIPPNLRHLTLGDLSALNHVPGNIMRSGLVERLSGLVSICIESLSERLSALSSILRVCDILELSRSRGLLSNLAAFRWSCTNAGLEIYRNGIMEIVGPCVREMELGFCGSPLLGGQDADSDKASKKLVRLRHVRFFNLCAAPLAQSDQATSTTPGAFATHDICRILSGLPNPRILRKIDFIFSPAKMDDLKHFLFSDIDVLLSGSSFENLTTVVVDIADEPHLNVFRFVEEVRSQMAHLNSKGILRLPLP